MCLPIECDLKTQLRLPSLKQRRLFCCFLMHAYDWGSRHLTFLAGWFHYWFWLMTYFLKIYLEVYSPFQTRYKDFIISNKCLINQLKLPKQQYLKSILASLSVIMSPTQWPVNLPPDPWPDESVNVPVSLNVISAILCFFLSVCVYLNILGTLFSSLIG